MILLPGVRWFPLAALAPPPATIHQPSGLKTLPAKFLSGPVQNRNGDGTKAEWVKMGARKRGTVASEEAGA